MNFPLLITDSLLTGILVYMCFRLFVLLRITRTNHKDYRVGSEEFWHFFEHVSAASISLAGALMTTVLEIIHTVVNARHHYALDGDASLEVGLNIGYSMIVISGIIFINHMVKEETPGHSFYHFKQKQLCSVDPCEDRIPGD